LESFFLTLGLLLITSAIVTYLGKAAAGLLKLNFSNFLYFPFGMALVLMVGFLAFKANISWVIVLAFAAILIAPTLIATRKVPLSSLISSKTIGQRLIDGLRFLTLPAISAVSVSLVVIFQTFTTRGQVPQLTSFDTTSGDMFSYLILADGLKSVGWEGQLNHVEVSVFDSGLGNLSGAFEHAGAGGYVLLALFATISGFKTWMIGTLVLLSSLQSVVMAAAGVIETNTKMGKWQSFLLGNLAFGTLAYLTVIGWWALNQIIFTLLFILLIWILSAMLANREYRRSPKYFLISGTLMALGIEVYPSVALYSMLPIFLVIIGLTIYQALSTGLKTILSAMTSFIPLTYCSLGTFQFLPQIFAAQFDHKLDLGYKASGLFDFLGFPNGPLAELFMPDFVWVIEALNAPLFWGLVLIVFTVLNAIGSRKKLFLLLPFILTSLGGGALITYTGFIPQTAYLAHKLVLMWYPLAILSVAIMFSQSSTQEKPYSLFFRKVGFVVLPAVIISNTLAASYYFSLAVKDPEARQLHTISNEALELNAKIQALETVAVMTDFSVGRGWGALDRTVLPAIVNYPGKNIESGGSLAGYPYYSGWTVTSSPKKVSVPSEGYVNEQYTLKYLCRLVCAERELGIAVFVAGLPTSPSEMDKYKNMTFSENQLHGPLSLRIQGKPGQKLWIEPKWAGAPHDNCRVNLPVQIGLDATGRARFPLGLGEDCPAKLVSVKISEAK
jgi:hypothetical protein